MLLTVPAIAWFGKLTSVIKRNLLLCKRFTALENVSLTSSLHTLTPSSRTPTLNSLFGSTCGYIMLEYSIEPTSCLLVCLWSNPSSCPLTENFWKHLVTHFPANIYLFKVNNRNTSERCEICSKLAIKTSGRRHWRCSGVFTVNFEHTSYLILNK